MPSDDNQPLRGRLISDYTDIHSAAIDAAGNDITRNGAWQDERAPFGGRNYSVFAFLAGVKNFSGIAPIAPARGLPPDARCARWKNRYLGQHSFSWLLIEELDAFDYDAEMEDRRIYMLGNKGDYPRTLPPGRGERHPWRTFLTPSFFADLAELNRIGADRVVFGFDG